MQGSTPQHKLEVARLTLCKMKTALDKIVQIHGMIHPDLLAARTRFLEQHRLIFPPFLHSGTFLIGCGQSVSHQPLETIQRDRMEFNYETSPIE